MDMPIDVTQQDAATTASAVDLAQMTNAFVQVVPPETPAPQGPLAGLRFGVKEVIDQKGLLSPWGVPFLSARVGEVEAPVVARIRQAGAIRVGTTRSTLMAITGDSGARNPRDLSRTPGGSSAGSAAAVRLAQWSSHLAPRPWGRSSAPPPIAGWSATSPPLICYPPTR